MSLRAGKTDPSVEPTVTPNAPEIKPYTEKHSKLQHLEDLCKAWAKKVNGWVVNSSMFEKQAKKAFEEADADKNGIVDAMELQAGILVVYDQLNIKMPTHVPAPSRKQILELFDEADANHNGGLEFPEFLFICKKLMGFTSLSSSILFKVIDFVLLMGKLMGITSLSSSILFKVIYFVLLRLCFLPLVASIIQSVSKHFALTWVLSVIPTMVYVLGFELVIKSVLHLNY
eukprot:gene6102-2700_t